MKKSVLVTGGAGFIGSSLARFLLNKGAKVIVLDLLTYAGSLENITEIKSDKNLLFVKGDIRNHALVLELLREHKCETIFHLAAESHVDNSISGPSAFIETNVLGTCTMLEAAREYWIENNKPSVFRFIHVSTDEVFGQLDLDDEPFHEKTPYNPRSPYSSSKAGSDHLARAWHHTYGLPVIITNCSNNFGPRQHQEKLIPTVIRSAMERKNIPIYGSGQNIRDWLFVDDHCNGLILAAENGTPGESYCLGGGTELQNIELVKKICSILDETAPRSDAQSYQTQITFVQDRLGHDWRYAIDCSFAEKELGYKTTVDFDLALRETIAFYVNQQLQGKMAS